jgi:hypothetical protein
LLEEVSGGPLAGDTVRRYTPAEAARAARLTGARWRAERVGPVVELLALCATVEWNEHWKVLAA